MLNEGPTLPGSSIFLSIERCDLVPGTIKPLYSTTATQQVGTNLEIEIVKIYALIFSRRFETYRTHLSIDRKILLPGNVGPSFSMEAGIHTESPSNQRRLLDHNYMLILSYVPSHFSIKAVTV